MQYHLAPATRRSAMCLGLTLVSLVLSGCVVSADATDSIGTGTGNGIVNPADHTSITPERTTEILILGTPHLRVLGDDFSRSSMTPLIERLVALKPDVIGVESLAARVIIGMQAAQYGYEETLKYFVEDKHLALGRVAQDVLQESPADARRLAEELINGRSGCEIGGSRRLILAWLAAYEFESAVLIWSYLPESQRSAGEGINEAMAKKLNDTLYSANEVYGIAIPVARALCHSRLAQIDDHSDKDDYGRIDDALNAFLQSSSLVADVMATNIYTESQQVLAESNRLGDVLPAYRYINSDDYATADIEAQWDLFVRTKMPGGEDRARLAFWDVRNLGIAANIRRETWRYPGGKMLVIIGASHKPFLDSYLRHSIDVSVLPASSVLD